MRLDYIHSMVLNFFLILILSKSAISYPQNLRIPEIKVSPPQDVNNLGYDENYGRSINSQSQNTNNDIENTIKEVENIIKSNPALPRLTRGEILDLIENITSTDEKKLRKSKAIMVVMPFTPSNNDKKNMEELYTKPPVTHIIGAEPFKPNPEATQFKRRRKPVVSSKFQERNEVSDKKQNEKITTKSTTSIPIRNRKRKPEATTEKNLIVPTTYNPRKSLRRRTTTITTTIPTKHPNHRYPDDEITTQKEFVPSNGLRIIQPPKLAPPQEINDDLSSDLRFAENIKQEVILEQKIPVAQELSGVIVTAAPTITKTTNQPTTNGINLPENLIKVVKDLNLESALNGKSNFDFTSTSTTKIPTTTNSPTTTSSTIMPDVSNVAESLSPEMRDLLISFGLMPNPNEKPYDPNEAEEFVPDKAEVKAESYVGFKPLPADGPSRNGMEALLASFGLGRSARKQKAIVNKPKKENQYNFEMVPDNLKDVLTDLGLSNREEKKIRTTNQEKNLEKHVFNEKTLEKHVFNPDNQYASDEELQKLSKLMDVIRQLEKLNGTATDEDLKKIDLANLNELIGSLNNSTKSSATLDAIYAPDPNKYDSGVIKNEIKRQENTTTTTSSSTTTTTSTTEESRSPSFSDLEASFGGESAKVTEAPPPETTTNIRTGFYYLVDWNTFLDIDDQKGKRVNLRFQPTIGDPKRFLSVTVP